MRRQLTIGAIFFFSIIACTPQTVATPSPSHPPTETATPTVVSIPTWFESPEPTLTDIPPATISAQQTIEAASASACNDGIPAADNPLSPDGQWAAVICATITHVFRLDGVAAWQVPFYETYGRFPTEAQPDGIRKGRMNLIHWSSDSQFAYFVPDFCCLDAPEDDFLNYFRTGAALYRLDLNSGKITTTLPPNLTDVFAGYSFAFSPNEKYLVYDGKGNEISLHNLQTGETKQINPGDQYRFCAGFKWSPDSKQLAFLAPHSVSEQSVYTYFVMSVSDLMPRLLMEKNEIYRFAWSQENPSLLKFSSDAESLSFDLALTPTP